jgi:hypothetical protein
MNKTIILIVISVSLLISNTVYSNTDKIVLILSDEENNEVMDGVDDFSDKSFKVHQITTKPSDNIKSHIDKLNPDYLVLLDLENISKYKNYSNKNGTHLKTIIANVDFVDDVIHKNKLSNIKAVRNTTPVILPASLLRYHTKSTIKTVGVVYREKYNNFIKRNVGYGPLEGVSIHKEMIPDDSDDDSIEKAFNKLSKSGVDAIWIMNDPRYLDNDIIVNKIKNSIKEYNHPVIVNNKKYIDNGVGTILAETDDYDIGLRVNDSIRFYNRPDRENIIEALSVNAILNLKSCSERNITVNKKRLIEINTVN